MDGVRGVCGVCVDLRTLCVWWALWTLADQLLIKYHPWSELTVLFVCAFASWAPALRETVRLKLVLAEKGLVCVTQTENAENV